MDQQSAPYRPSVVYLLSVLESGGTADIKTGISLPDEPPGNFMIFIVYFIYQLILNVIEHSDDTDVGVALLRNGEEENTPMLDFFLNCCEQSNLVY